MAQINWSEPALSDLNEIAEYIALDKENAAKKLVQHVFSATDRLKQFPKSGRKPSEIETTEYREIIVGPCRIFYRVKQNEIYILYVMRSERKLRKFIIDDRANESS
ncbi:MAG: type II toxin-antitoxin system RelE/ParE family toxin [gamma proteobacterium symbiont of Bathyaustriella thionipta]|nr:type II toxin-antitoxin system RelE/ParE family toxin [gamma proteobacterium symbiont of Bathyaustriella thionipta]MCU7951380.1 type II toxin-antitoxin system RelE/ParE family toxin [gamma proteobacterium symbiont of Bathyaustriella thionipta]MCU7957933.1 type II toxin-antitoxin system RelE/ParE family toxin [gamma proteobacterium symbiont of Bathyaustriella thionipta]MCU7965739.1 type II toxin-antitoxin system RelE/ParE family toxin [gamma proteobacterium symbiont of Bathyaustriella thionipt